MTPMEQIVSRADELIDRIEHIRRINNENWMDIVRVAMKHAPAETKAILQKINRSDRMISSAVEQLAGE